MLHFENHSVYNLYRNLSGGFNRLDILVKLKQKKQVGVTIRNKLWNWNHLYSIPNEGWFLFQYMFIFIPWNPRPPTASASPSHELDPARDFVGQGFDLSRPRPGRDVQKASLVVMTCINTVTYVTCYTVITGLCSQYSCTNPMKQSQFVTLIFQISWYPGTVKKKMLWNQLYENCTLALTTICTWICRWYLSSAWSTILIYGVHIVPYCTWLERKKKGEYAMPNHAQPRFTSGHFDPLWWKMFYKCASPELWCPIHQSTSAKHDLDISHHFNQAAVKHKTCRLSKQLWIVVCAVIWFARKVHMA